MHHSEIQSFYEQIKKQFDPKVGFELRLGRRKKDLSSFFCEKVVAS